MWGCRKIDLIPILVEFQCVWVSYGTAIKQNDSIAQNILEDFMMCRHTHDSVLIRKHRLQKYKLKFVKKQREALKYTLRAEFCNLNTISLL